MNNDKHLHGPNKGINCKTAETIDQARALRSRVNAKEVAMHNRSVKRLPVLPMVAALGLVLLAPSLVPGTGTPAEQASTADTVERADSRATAAPAGVAHPAADRWDASSLTYSAAEIAQSTAVAASQGATPQPGDTVRPAADDTADRASSAQPTTRAAARAKMSSSVAALADAGGDEPVELVISYAEHPELFDAARVLELGGELIRVYNVLDAQTIRLPAFALYELAYEPNVDRLSLDESVQLMSLTYPEKASNSRHAAGVPETTSANHAYTGQGVGVAILDTGIAMHTDIDQNVLQYSFLNGAYPTPNVLNGQIVAHNDDPREDLFGHGTHVAGIVSGTGAASNDSFHGAAEGASLLSLQVLDEHGNGSMSDVMAALDWLLQYGSYFDVRVANLSLGKGITESIETDPLVLAVEALWDQGIVVVAAAGNLGSHGAMTIKSPGNSRKIITVGSLTDAGTYEFSDDYVSSYSSRGPSMGDYVVKPDLVAPGNRIVAAIPEVAQLRVDMADRLVGGLTCVVSILSDTCPTEYLELSGTSMATPLVAAAAAVMLQKDPSLTPATVKARLMRSARKIADDPTAAGAGVLDMDAALNETGVVTGEALSPVLVRDEASNGYLVEDTAALWGGDTWAASDVWADGNLWSDSVTGDDYLWADRNLWADGNLWADSDLWADGNLWADSNLWADRNLWADSVED